MGVMNTTLLGPDSSVIVNKRSLADTVITIIGQP